MSQSPPEATYQQPDRDREAIRSMQPREVAVEYAEWIGAFARAQRGDGVTIAEIINRLVEFRNAALARGNLDDLLEEHGVLKPRDI